VIVTSKISQDSVKVYFNDILHIHFLRARFLGLQSYQYEAEGMYYIEVVLTGGSFTCDYDRADLWLGVLAELEKAR